MKVLLIEDELRIADFIRDGLRQYGVDLIHCDRGEAGLQRLRAESFDVLVLDIMLPGRDGLSVLQELRESGLRTPVILLTARNELADRITGLGLGADDYLAKPFYVEELHARLQALQRRGRENLLEAAGLRLDRLTRQASCNGELIDLTSREYGLLECLMRVPGAVLSRAQLLEKVWGYDFDPSTNVVDVSIKRLRAKIAAVQGADTSSPIEAVRGSGYRFRSPDNQT